MGRARTHTSSGVVLDAGALIAWDRGDKRIIALLRRASSGRFGVTAVFELTWRGSCAAKKVIVPLDVQLAKTCGELCGAAKSMDIIDASVVVLARMRREPFVTSDPNDLRRLDPAAEIISI